MAVLSLGSALTGLSAICSNTCSQKALQHFHTPWERSTKAFPWRELSRRDGTRSSMQPHHCMCPGQMELSAQGGISELLQTPDFTKACKIGPVFSRTAAGTPPIKCLLQKCKRQ